MTWGNRGKTWSLFNGVMAPEVQHTMPVALYVLEVLIIKRGSKALLKYR